MAPIIIILPLLIVGWSIGDKVAVYELMRPGEVGSVSALTTIFLRRAGLTRKIIERDPLA